MFSVYLIRSKINPHKTYIGFTTKNVLERLKEHNAGLTRTTRFHTPWLLEVGISFSERNKAEAFEKYLKKGSGYVFAKRHFWSTKLAE